MREFSGHTASRAYWAVSFVVSFFLSSRTTPRTKNVLTNAVNTDMKVADDVLEGGSLKESAKRRMPTGIKRTVRGLKFQSGSGVRRVKSDKKKRKIHDVFS